jgi:hypothetical protein
MEDFTRGCTPFCLDLLQSMVTTNLQQHHWQDGKKQKIRQMTFILDISSKYHDSIVLTMTEAVFL